VWDVRGESGADGGQKPNGFLQADGQAQHHTSAHERARQFCMARPAEYRQRTDEGVAVAFGVQYTNWATQEGTAVTQTLSVTIPSGCNLLIVSGGSGEETDNLTVTVNGSAATEIVDAVGTTWARTKQFRFDNPAAGTYDVVSTRSPNTSFQRSLGVVAFSDADLAALTVDPNNGGNSTPSTPVTESAGPLTTVAGNIVVSSHYNDIGTNGGTLTSQTGTVIGNGATGFGDSYTGMQYETASGSSTTPNWVFQDTLGSGAWACVACVVVAAGGGGAPIIGRRIFVNP
jgi:hypothetical protein